MNHTATTGGLLAMLLATQLHAEPFTYQGKLDDSAGLAATYDFQFQLLDGSNPDTASQVDSLQLEDVALSNGIFTVELDFTAASFDGTPYWLEVSVRPGTSTGTYTALSPTQPIQAAPEAQVSLLSLSAAAGSIDSAAIADGSITAADTDGSFQQRVTGSCAAGSSIASIAADGTVTCEADDDTTYAAGSGISLSGTTISVDTGTIQARVGACTGNSVIQSIAADGTPSCKADDTGSDWSLAGNVLTGTEWLGSSNDQPVEIRANGRRVLRVQDALNGAIHAPNILAGAEFNEITAGAAGATVAGGGGDPTRTDCGDGTQPCINRVATSFATVSGGWGNTASQIYSAVGGGYSHTAGGTASTIAGGYNNSIPFSGDYAAILGGRDNVAGGALSTVLGGTRNLAGGWYSLTAGYRAKVRQAGGTAGTYYSGDTNGDEGTFVWADTTEADFVSTGPNQFLVRASGGVWFGNNSTVSFPSGSFLATSTGAYLTTGGTWTNSSDKNRKEHFEPVDSDALLEKIATLPIRRWNYRDEDDAVKHIGPTAQDFHAAFGLGQDDKHIATVDADGVALAAIQALTRQLNHANRQIERLHQQLEQLQQQQRVNQTLTRRVTELEQQLSTLPAPGIRPEMEASR